MNQVSERFAIEKIVDLVRVACIWMIILVVGGMIAHNTLALFFKAARGMPYQRQPGLFPRFSSSECCEFRG